MAESPSAVARIKLTDLGIAISSLSGDDGKEEGDCVSSADWHINCNVQGNGMHPSDSANIVHDRIRITSGDCRNNNCSWRSGRAAASVVKELLETLWTRSARSIRIETESGGKRLIRW